MPKFIFVYRSGEQFKNPEDGARHYAKWTAWVEGLGDSLVSPSTPLGAGRTVSSSGVSEDSASPLRGYSILQAADLNAAIEIARGCPHTDIGVIEVAELAGT